MQRWTEADLKKQLDSAVSHGWIKFFGDAAAKHGFTVDLLLAIASRETRISDIKGDFHDNIYHGFGIMQVDIKTNPEFCKAWTENMVEASIECGVRILEGKRRYLATKNITDLKAIAAAYNTGEGNVAKSIAAGKDPDHTTAGGDYGADVIARMNAFAKLRASAATA